MAAITPADIEVFEARVPRAPRDLVILSGPEPAYRWRTFCETVIELAEALGVQMVVTLGALLADVPHTRPITLTAHANDKELIADHQPWVGEVQVPGSVSNLLEFRMAQHGHEVVGFTVHVPHYLAQTDFPSAAEAQLKALPEVAGYAVIYNVSVK